MRRDTLAWLGARALTRRLGLPRARRFRVERALPVRMRDGAVLLADHYVPRRRRPAGVLLMRGPYGRGGLPTRVFAGLYAGQGFHVVLQSTRGTFGSDGVFEPGRHEVDDGADTVRWLREQPWYTGEFATVGASYLGFTQLALLVDQPDDLTTSVITMAPHDFGHSVWSTGSFALGDFLGWSYQVAWQHRGGWIRQILRGMATPRTLKPVLATLPIDPAAEELLGGHTPWFNSWLEQPDPTSPYWAEAGVAAALDNMRGPVLLITGWQDAFVDQTLEQYRRLRERGVEVAMTVGPWTHGSGGTEAIKESVLWMDGSRRAAAPVRICVAGGADEGGDWRDLQRWPPPAVEQVWHLRPGAALAATPPDSGAPSTFVYDPADPTPSIGGRLLVSGKSGYVDDTELAVRSDVLAFNSPVLTADVDVIGTPYVELSHRTDNPHADVFVRISDVAPDGHSTNVTDGYLRLTAADAPEALLRLELDATAYRFAAGHRIRLLIAGGCFPRFARNLGTDDPLATATRMVPSVHTVAHGDGGQSRLVLPVSAP